MLSVFEDENEYEYEEYEEYEEDEEDEEDEEEEIILSSGAAGFCYP